MRAALALILLASPAYACDWLVTEHVDSMTDGRSCQISSANAKLSLFVYPDFIRFATGTAYRHSGDSLTVRIDDNEAIVIGKKRATKSYFPPDSESARRAIDEIQTGQRIRVRFNDYPSPQEGDAPICNLPDLIRSCHAD